MSVLDSFTEEMLQSELPKRVTLERLIHGLEVEKPPKFPFRHRNIPLKRIYTAFGTITSIKLLRFPIK